MAGIRGHNRMSSVTGMIGSRVARRSATRVRRKLPLRTITWEVIMTRLLPPHRRIVALTIYLLATATGGIAQITGSGPLDFLKSKDSTFALFVNTSNILEGSLSDRVSYPNELVLLTGLPLNPNISARVDLLGAVRLCFLCGGLRNVVISPDGDTALVSSE